MPYTDEPTASNLRAPDVLQCSFSNRQHVNAQQWHIWCALQMDVGRPRKWRSRSDEVCVLLSLRRKLQPICTTFSKTNFSIKMVCFGAFLNSAIVVLDYRDTELCFKLWRAAVGRKEIPTKSIHDRFLYLNCKPYKQTRSTPVSWMPCGKSGPGPLKTYEKIYSEKS